MNIVYIHIFFLWGLFSICIHSVTRTQHAQAHRINVLLMDRVIVELMTHVQKLVENLSAERPVYFLSPLQRHRMEILLRAMYAFFYIKYVTFFEFWYL